MANYCSLHNHTASSNIRFLDCINRPEEMVTRAIELGYNGMAFTDHESLSSGISLLKIRDSIKESNPDFKIIFGNEIYLIDETKVQNTTDYFHFILLAKDLEGWQQLKTLSSRAWYRGYMDRGIMRVPTTYQDIEEVVGSNPGHLIASTACLGGQLAKAILNRDKDTINWFIPWMIKNFGKENVFLEMQPSDSEEQITVNKYILKLAKYFELKFIITTDSHYLNKEDAPIHSAYLNSKQSTDRETEKFYKFTYLLPIDEIISIMAAGGVSEGDVQEAFANTQYIRDSITDFDFRHSTIVPKTKLPQFEVRHLLKDWYDSYPIIKYYAYSESDQDRYLMYQIENGIISKGVEIDAVKAERINTELDIVLFISQRLEQDLSAYLNLTANIVNLAWQVSLVGCGRGSACGFYINYLTGITQVDPLPYDLPYWRFLNKERAEMPDVDEDFQPEKTEDIISILREEYGEDNVLNCATFKTEGLKSAILSCARGLGINNDDAAALAAMVPSNRGKLYSLEECLHGNEEKGLEPVPNFEEKIRKYEGLFEAIKKIEGLPTNASIHASALYIFNDGYLAHNSLMRAPNKTRMTAFNMHDSDDQGALKMDVLRTDAQSKMAKCLELLLKDKQIEWQGSLRATYDKYIHPDVLDYDNPDMWEAAAEGKISNLFQMETQVGAVAIAKCRPTSVTQLAEINSIMRLQAADGEEQPIDRYARFCEHPELWDLEMIEEGLEQEEIAILKKYLEKCHGVSGSQEVLMRILMDPQITGFTLGEANAARKAISKKISEKIIQLRTDFFDKGTKLNTRPVFLDYVWKYCIAPQLGYSFSLNHTLPYSVIAVQEMNLATRWNPLYWACACLCVNSGNYADNLEETDEDEDEITEEVEEIEEDSEDTEETATKEKRVAPNYGKIAKAITDAQHAGVNIELPYINEAQADFVPDIENNSILYSLQAINVVNPELFEKIEKFRPFNDIRDFIEKVEPTNVQMIGLIKAGCFDKLYKVSRRQIMSEFFQILAAKNITKKDKITATQLKQAIDLKMHLEDYQEQIRLFKYKRYLDKYQLSPDTKNSYRLTESDCLKFFHIFVEKGLSLSKGEYEYLSPDEINVKISAFKKWYDQALLPLMNYLNSEEGLEEFYKLQKGAFINELDTKYCSGSIAAWEMETMSFYHEPHELHSVDRFKYNIKNFNELPEIPVTRIETKGEKTFTLYDICAVAGTVIKTDNTRKIVTLVTLDGVVDVKFYAANYIQYNKKISTIDPKTNKKTTFDDSWFRRGSKIIVYGYRRENTFVAKNERSSGFKRLVGKINGVFEGGSLDVEFTRKKVTK